jgi:hypothetical protein
VPGGTVHDFFSHSPCSVVFVLLRECGFGVWFRRSRADAV